MPLQSDYLVKYALLLLLLAVHADRFCRNHVVVRRWLLLFALKADLVLSVRYLR